MTHILRIAKDRQHPYVVISNELAENDTLSYAARGMMLYLLAKPDDWTVRMTDLENASNGQGRTAVRSIFSELQDAGYVERKKTRTDSGTWAYETTVYESARLSDATADTRGSSTVDGFSVDGSTADGSVDDIVSTHSPSTHKESVESRDSTHRQGDKRESKAKAREPSALQRKQRAVQTAVREHFEAKTGLACPEKGNRKGIATLWWNPVREICEKCDYDAGRAMRVVDEALDKLDGLTVTDPNSILKTSRAVVAEQNRKRTRARAVRADDGTVIMPVGGGSR